MGTFYWILLILAISGISVYSIYIIYRFILLRSVYLKYSEDDKPVSFDLNNEYYKYLSRVHPYMYRIKLPSSNVKTMNKTQFVNTYLKSVRHPTKSESDSLLKRCVRVDKILDTYKLHVLRKLPWKFMIGHPELELGFPYTIGDYIVIPSKMVHDITVETLLHEKIHIYQRKYPQQCKLIYEYMMPFAHEIGKNMINVPPEILQTKMTNPDENGEIWIYYYQGKWYYPSLQMGLRQRTEQIGFQVDVSKRPMQIIPYKTIPLKKMSTFDSYASHVSVYHPHEIFACVLANHLIQGHSIHKDLEKHMNMDRL